MYRRAGRVVVSSMQGSIISKVCYLKLCTIQEADCKSFIQPMHAISRDQSTVSVLLVDYSLKYARLQVLHASFYMQKGLFYLHE